MVYAHYVLQLMTERENYYQSNFNKILIISHKTAIRFNYHHSARSINISSKVDRVYGLAEKFCLSW